MQQSPSSPNTHTNQHKTTRGQKAADFIAAHLGSWPFLIGQTVILIIWMAFNSVAFFHPFWFDHKPYMLLNFVLSLQAAFTGPVVMISQNRQEEIAKTIILGMRDTQNHQMLIMEALQAVLEEQRQNLKDVVEENEDISQTVDEILDIINNVKNPHEKEDYDDDDIS